VLPTSAALGVPASVPVVGSKVAHAGAFCTLKLSASPVAPAVAGRKLYSAPGAATVAGSPVIASAALLAPVSVGEFSAVAAEEELGLPLQPARPAHAMSTTPKLILTIDTIATGSVE
jgi:hypothetical protein